jgi:nicotinic acid mononucleotide adenylyltransferase
VVAPCCDHPLGKALAPFERRMTWLRLALDHYGERVEVSAIEAEQAGDRGGRPSYTLELLEALAARHPEARIRLVVGSDIIRSGETARWHRWDQIAARFDPIVVDRAGWSEPEVAALPEVSSTAVRAVMERLREGEGGSEADRAALARLVPAGVASDRIGFVRPDRLRTPGPRKGRGHDPSRWPNPSQTSWPRPS